MADRDSISATIAAYMAAYATDDRAAWLACFSDDAWVEDPAGTPRRQGLDAIGAVWDEAHAIPDVVERRLLDICVIVGDEAVFTAQIRPNLGGDTYAIDVIEQMTFGRDAKITSLRVFSDSGAMRPADD